MTHSGECTRQIKQPTHDRKMAAPANFVCVLKVVCLKHLTDAVRKFKVLSPGETFYQMFNITVIFGSRTVNLPVKHGRVYTVPLSLMLCLHSSANSSEWNVYLWLIRTMGLHAIQMIQPSHCDCEELDVFQSSNAFRHALSLVKLVMNSQKLSLCSVNEWIFCDCLDYQVAQCAVSVVVQITETHSKQ